MRVNTYFQNEDLYEVLQQRLQAQEEQKLLLERRLNYMNKQLKLKEELIGNLQVDLEHVVDQLHKLRRPNNEYSAN